MKVERIVKKYFVYEDNLRTIVSVVSGIFILIFNIFSGFLIVYSLIRLLSISAGIGELIIIFPLSYLVGFLLISMCIFMVNVMLIGTEVDTYSYVRLILLFAIVIYILTLVIYILFVILFLV